MDENSRCKIGQFASMDRREVLKLCGTLLGGATIAASFPGCDKDLEPAFEPGDAKKIGEGAQVIVETLLAFLTDGITNDEAMQKCGQLLDQVGIGQSTLYGAMEPLNQFGHVIIFNSGSKGFLRLEVHNDQRYVEPLILRKGQEPLPVTLAAAGNGCKVTTVCTNTIDLGGGSSTHDFDDQGAEDPQTGLIPGYVFAARSQFDPNEIQLHVDILKKSAELLEEGGNPNPEPLYEWLNDRKAGLKNTQAFVSVSEIRKVIWYDWLIMFSNGTSSFVQVAKGDLQPVHALYEKLIDPHRVDISFDSVPTNVLETMVLFPHVSQRS